MSILSDQTKRDIDALVSSGRYRSEEDAITDGIRLVRDREHRLALLDNDVARGVADIDHGRVRTASDVFTRLRARYAQSVAESTEPSS